MTELELQAGAEAVRKVAAKYHVESWLNINQLREIAARVIEAHDRVHADAAADAAEESAKAHNVAG